MGGMAGHLPHVHEALDLTIQEIKVLLWKVKSGKTNVYEKVDGQNLFVTWSESTRGIRSARNLRDIGCGGLDRWEHVKRWKSHPAEIPFTQGFLAAEEAFHSIPRDERQEIFGQMGDRWVSIEIMCEASPNVIRYSGNHIVLHGMHDFSPDRSVRDAEFDRLIEVIGGTTGTVHGNIWSVHGPVQVTPLSDRPSAYWDVCKALSKFAEGDTESTLSALVARRLRQGEVGALRLAVDRQERLIRRILHTAGSRSAAGAESLRDLGAGLSRSTQREMSRLATVEGARKTVLRATYPIECAISDFATVILDGVQSNFVRHHQAEVDNLRHCTARSIQVLRDYRGSDWKQYREMVEKQAEKLGDVSNITSTLEGVVFDHPHEGQGRLKLTGTFAPMNQIVGRAMRLPLDRSPLPIGSVG